MPSELEERVWTTPPWQSLVAGPEFRLADLDRSATPGWTGRKRDAKALLAEIGEELADLQERLYANGRKGDERAVLLVLQGIDTAGKGGIARHVIGMVDPQGVVIRGFGPPTPEERKHHYLWRIRRALPPPGRIGVFDRSHYEDVLVVRVDGLVEEEVWRKRYDEINRFEAKVAEGGTTIVKCALMVSHEEQGARLLARLDRPNKHWKYSSSDLRTRLKWDDYQEAYEDVFARTSTDVAPWHVIPADHKWYARLVVASLLTRALRGMDLQWPAADFDVAAERAKLAATMAHPEIESIEATDAEQDVAEEEEGAEAEAEAEEATAETEIGQDEPGDGEPRDGEPGDDEPRDGEPAEPTGAEGATRKRSKGKDRSGRRPKRGRLAAIRNLGRS